MPLFKYRCLDCQTNFEDLLPFSQSHDVECPNCSSHNTEKLVTSFATLGSSSSSSTSSVSSCGSGRGGFT
ncbi:MAG: zinc ribbon domain-containing protein [bacterium]|nr:MAG: zinc ribbon domain-containing protein [bacterium]